jgi:hypothetical protein
MSLTRAACVGLSLWVVAASRPALAQSQVKPRLVVIVDTSGSMVGTPQQTADFPAGLWTHGDGSAEHPGCDVTGDGVFGDSKIFQAKNALYNVVSAYGEVEFALERFKQAAGGEGCGGAATTCTAGGTECVPPFACQGGHCAKSCSAPGDCPPHDTCATGQCVADAANEWSCVDTGATGWRVMHCPSPCQPWSYTQCTASFACSGCADTGPAPTPEDTCVANRLDATCHGDPSPLGGTIACASPTDSQTAFQSCLYYNGRDRTSVACHPPDYIGEGEVLVGFPTAAGDNIAQVLAWIDHHEADFLGGTDRELRANGDTPLGGALVSAGNYLVASVLPGDAQKRTCRAYNVVLLTDGAETCGGGPAVRAQLLHQGIRCNGASCCWPYTSPSCTPAQYPESIAVKVWGVGFAVCPPGEPNCQARRDLNNIAALGGTGTAYFVQNQVELQAALAEIIAQSIPAEICDGLDNDCNGLTDEGFPVGDPCDDGGQGICRGTGHFVCRADHLGVECAIEVPGQPPTTEVCNGLDDDCDGATDEGIPCGDEVCNGVDDDDDGATDEHPCGDWTVCPLPGEMVPCGLDVGECVPGLTKCTSGALGCDLSGPGQHTPVAEACDCQDNNCNGVTDEGLFRECYTGPAGTKDVGPCRGAVQVCATTPGPACVPDVWSNPTCLGQALPESEVCNGLDDDCDGLVDDPPPGGALPGVGEPCVTPGGCPGHTICAGALVCQADHAEAEVCNGLDDDCDAMVDEAPGPGEPPLCDPTGARCAGDACVPDGVERVCTAGHYVCTGGGIDCAGAVLPEPEACDCRDNDCDGATDEGDLCGAGRVCFACECVMPCKEDEFPCPGGRVCLDGANLDARVLCARPGRDPCYCVPSACFEVECPSGWLCSEQDGQCYDLCAGVTCPAEQECRFGACVDCRVLGCPECQVCAGGQCIENPCCGVTCPTGSYCTGGACVTSCDLLSCPAGTMCRAGECVPDRCGDLGCSGCTFCEPTMGSCVADPCCGVTCPAGTACARQTGRCQPDPCLTATCGACEECQTDPYFMVATCDWLPDCERLRVVATGGGCRAAAGAAGGLLVPLLAVPVLLARRRRR